MFGYLEGYSDTDSIFYCPACGTRVGIFHSDGTATCAACGQRFGIIVVSEEEED